MSKPIHVDPAHVDPATGMLVCLGGIKFKKLDPRAETPTKASSGASGFDLVSIEDLVLPSGGRALVRTGLAMAIPAGYEAQVRPRSGLAAKNGVTVLNSPGTIDSDFRGEVKVILHNTGPVFSVQAGTRIAQLVIQRVPEFVFEEVTELPETERGSGGFGSTGI